MNFLSIYLTQIQNITTTDKEHTHRTALENLLKSLQESLALGNKDLAHIRIKHEPNNDKEGRGAPDFLIQNQGLIIGYIENKRVGADLDSIAQSSQIAKYLQLSENILLTDYLRFCLVRKSEKINIGGGASIIIQECRICELSQIKTTLKNKSLLESKLQELSELFSLFFSHNPKPINTALEFASTLARRTQILKDFLIQTQENSHISSLYDSFKEQLYKELDFSEFADSFAQTLTYSLFLARLNNTKNQEIDLFNAKKFIPKSFSLIRAMSGFLDNLDDLESIKWLLEEILCIINHIDISSIINELNKTSKNDNEALDYTHKDPYLHFYETFLSQYDPKMREIRGVYYTPASVVSFIINAIDYTLKNELKLPKGLGASLENPHITLLDFATGTGTFLLEAFRKALESIPKNSPKYEPKKLLHQFSGLEYLIAPYTIAHLKLSQSFKEEFNAPLKDDEFLNIRLTNTLYFRTKKDELNQQINLFAGMIELAEEFKGAQEIKENKILIITGNPPYSGASANKGLFEDNVRISYGLEPSEAELSKEEQRYINLYLQEPNNTEYKKTFKQILERKKLKNEKTVKWLLDDYVKFICFAESKIKEQESGIFAFISNNAFLDNPTFRGMRYSLLKTFDEIYILDLHGNTRKKEISPDGSKDENVFDIMQGVSINIFIKNINSSLTQDTRICDAKSAKKSLKNNEESQNHAQIYHYDLYGKRKDKYSFLYANSLDSIAWTKLKPKNPFYLFIPQNESLRAEYDKGWSVKDIFRVSSVGIASGNDSFCISSSDSEKSLQELKQRILTFLKLDIESARKEFNIGDDSRSSWQIVRAKEDLKKSNNSDKNYIKIAYRPFDYRWTYYTGKSSGFLGRPRFETMQHFLQGDNLGLIYKRGFPNTQSGHSFTTDSIIDFRSWSCSGMQGGDYISPLYLKNTKAKENKKDSKTKKLDSSSQNDNAKSKTQWVENFTPEFREFIDSKYNERFSPEAILGYIYAVLFHKDYREKYIDFLKIDFPKILFVESKEKFLTLSALGQELIVTHLMQDSQIERERERAENIENELQYWVSLSKTNIESRLYAQLHSTHDNGDVLHFQQNQRRQLSLPPLSLPKGKIMHNIGLVVSRRTIIYGGWKSVFVTQNIAELGLLGDNRGGGSIFPLYIKGVSNE